MRRPHIQRIVSLRNLLFWLADISFFGEFALAIWPKTRGYALFANLPAIFFLVLGWLSHRDYEDHRYPDE